MKQGAYARCELTNATCKHNVHDIHWRSLPWHKYGRQLKWSLSFTRYLNEDDSDDDDNVNDGNNDDDECMCKGENPCGRDCIARVRRVQTPNNEMKGGFTYGEKRSWRCLHSHGTSGDLHDSCRA